MPGREGALWLLTFSRLSAPPTFEPTWHRSPGPVRPLLYRLITGYRGVTGTVAIIQLPRSPV